MHEDHIHSALHQGGFRSTNLGFLPPWSGNADETTPDTQENTGTSQGQMQTTAEFGCSLPGPMQGLRMHLHRADGDKIWDEGKGTQERC